MALPLLASDLAGLRCGSTTPRRKRTSGSGKVMTVHRPRRLLLWPFHGTPHVWLCFWSVWIAEVMNAEKSTWGHGAVIRKYGVINFVVQESADSSDQSDPICKLKSFLIVLIQACGLNVCYANTASVANLLTVPHKLLLYIFGMVTSGSWFICSVADI